MGASLVEGEKVYPETSRGVRVESVRPGTPASRAGMMPGDRILHAGERLVRDVLDLYAASLEQELRLGIERRGDAMLLSVRRKRGEDLGFEIAPERPLVCNNKCVFCFVDQMPKGLRKALYIKDEDYRLSFLHGNYLTLTNIDAGAEARIVEMHLSPLYVSVHATDPEVRARLLGRRPAGPILDVLDRLGRAGIRFHTQIVLVPGYNDGAVLETTLEDLCARSEFILSVSVVPVGLTAHRTGLAGIDAVGPRLAAKAVAAVERFHADMRRRVGRGMVYAADELLLSAGLPIPEAEYYDDYPQIDNGVGLLRLLEESSKGLRVPGNLKGKHLVFATGLLARTHIEALATALARRGVEVKTVAVPNRLFGPSVTVAGLLAGRDIIEAIKDAGDADLVVLPPSVVNPDGLTLDGMSIEDISAAIGVPVLRAEYDFKQTLKRISHACRTA